MSLKTMHKNGKKTGVTPNVYLPKYKGLTSGQAYKQAALDASSGGECWWVENFLLHNRLIAKRES
mgnify:CR=1 FL=1|tara:strand:+ start:416 stop:610 length:195 start_codon:yes stop_codon:yes gene_type:complete